MERGEIHINTYTHGNPGKNMDGEGSEVIGHDQHQVYDYEQSSLSVSS